MLKRNKFAFVVLAAAMLAAGGRAWAVINPPSELALARGQKEAIRLLAIMDKDKNGKVSKEEFLNFMSAEFDRLDRDKSGELDVQELTWRPVGRPTNR